MGLSLISRHLSVLLLVSLLSGAHCYKILIYNPRMSLSHVNFFGRLADILVEAGYEVVTYMPEMDPDIKANGTKLARIIPGPHLDDAFSMGNITKNTWSENFEDLARLIKLLYNYRALHIKSCSTQVANDALMGQLRAEHFDFGIVELFSPCGFAVFRKIGLRNYASAFATDLFEVLSDPLGVSSNPSFVPTMYGSTGDKMNYWERMQNFLAYTKMLMIIIHLRKTVSNKEITKHLPDDYDLVEMTRKSSLAFVNSEELLEFPRLISHKIVFIGGIAVNKPKPLNEVVNFLFMRGTLCTEYQKIMNQSANGVVLVSFGSIAKSSNMPPHIKQSFLEAFHSFPEITFIWKYEEDDDYAADLPNVIKRKWIPQLDLLGHPGLRAFVSHCGLNSVEESVHQAVPLICIPLFGDQWHNARAAEKRNIGIYIDKYNLSPKTVKDAFRKILYDTRHREASQRLLEMIQNKPTLSRERFLRYIDFALKFGPIDSFDIAANNLSFIQYYLLDIIIPILLVFALIVYLILRLVLRVIRKLLFPPKVKFE